VRRHGATRLDRLLQALADGSAWVLFKGCRVRW